MCLQGKNCYCIESIISSVRQVYLHYHNLLLLLSNWCDFMSYDYQEDHFRPADSETCYACECYTIGSYRRSCDPVTGQCPCRNGVIGRRCDACASEFAEVTLRGCEGERIPEFCGQYFSGTHATNINSIYSPPSNLISYFFFFSCIRFLSQIIPARYLVGPHSIWSNGDPGMSQRCGWKCRSTLLREWLGRTGHVQMHLETIFGLSIWGKTWQCASKKNSGFIHIHICHTLYVFDLSINSKGLILQVEEIEEQGLKVTTFVAKNMMAKLAEATNRTEQLYGMDVNITYRVIKHVLDYEVLQSGLNLTHTQDRNFIQVSVVSLPHQQLFSKWEY